MRRVWGAAIETCCSYLSIIHYWILVIEGAQGIKEPDTLVSAGAERSEQYCVQFIWGGNSEETQ